MVTLMRIVTMTAVLAAIGCLGTAAAAQTYTDQELLELFQTQRDVFREAEQSTTGTTRGLTMVTVDDVTTTTGENATVTAQSDVADPNTPLTPQKVAFGKLETELQVNVRIEFAFDSAVLAEDQRPALAQLCQVMKASDINLFRIAGHTDASGTETYNEKLSLLRAEEVQRYLMSGCGIQPARLEAIGLGERFLFDGNDPKADANRRVEFQALS